MIASHVRSLILAAVFCTVGIASIMGMSAGSTPTTRPAATLADFAGWHAALPASRDLPARLALPGVLLEQVTRSFRTSLAGRRERYAVLAVNARGGQVKTMSELVGGYHGIERIAMRHAKALPAGWHALGDFHTHPALADDPRHIHGFSPADLKAFFARAAEKKLKVSLLADSGKVWMIVRTQTTMAAWPAVQKFLDAPRMSSFLTVADARARALDIPAEQRERWCSFHAGLSFNIRAARIRRVLPVYFDPSGRRHENAHIGGYALYVGNLSDGILERCDR